MAKEYAKAFYKSAQWQRCRRSYIDSRVLIDGGLCEICHDGLGYIVHHKIIITADNIHDANITLNHNNLQYVCKACHDRMDEHAFIKNKNKLNCIFDCNGNPILPPKNYDGDD